MTWAPIALQVVGAAFTAYSAVKGSANNKAAYNYQAAVSRNNAMIADWNAKDIARRGENDLTAHRRKVAQLAGTQRATFAGRGIDMSEGSALNILTDTEYFGEQDAITIKDNTAKNVWGAKVQGYNDSTNAELLQARSDSENPLLSGGVSLLTGAGQVADSWYKYKKAA